MNETLANIQEARPFEDLTVDEVAKARPEITKAVETMIKKGKWTVPGYRVRTIPVYAPRADRYPSTGKVRRVLPHVVCYVTYAGLIPL